MGKVSIHRCVDSATDRMPTLVGMAVAVQLHGAFVDRKIRGDLLAFVAGGAIVATFVAPFGSVDGAQLQEVGRMATLEREHALGILPQFPDSGPRRAG